MQWKKRFLQSYYRFCTPQKSWLSLRPQVSGISLGIALVRVNFYRNYDVINEIIHKVLYSRYTIVSKSTPWIKTSNHFPSAVNLHQVGQPLSNFLYPEWNKSLKSNQRTKNKPCSLPKDKTMHTIPNSNSMISHWNERNVWPT